MTYFKTMDVNFFDIVANSLMHDVDWGASEI